MAAEDCPDVWTATTRVLLQLPDEARVSPAALMAQKLAEKIDADPNAAAVRQMMELLDGLTGAQELQVVVDDQVAVTRGARRDHHGVLIDVQGDDATGRCSTPCRAESGRGRPSSRTPQPRAGR